MYRCEVYIRVHLCTFMYLHGCIYLCRFMYTSLRLYKLPDDNRYKYTIFSFCANFDYILVKRDLNYFDYHLQNTFQTQFWQRLAYSDNLLANSFKNAFQIYK